MPQSDFGVPSLSPSLVRESTKLENGGGGGGGIIAPRAKGGRTAASVR